MFSFIIYDQKAGSVFAARDRFGIKPLYYWTSSDGQIYVASEIKQFTCLPGWKPIVNEQMAYDFLNHSLLDHTEQTLFQSVFQLRPGHYLAFSVHSPKLQPQVWYNFKLEALKRKEVETADTAGESPTQKFLSLFKSAVQFRLRSDVTIGSCLSGGLDSSSIVCLMTKYFSHLSKNNGKNQKTFSSCSEIKKFDEREFIDEIVAATHVEAHFIYPEQKKLFEVLEKLTWHQDEPFVSTSIFAQWSVFELAKKNNVKVVLDGQGADEQLAGYHSYFPIYWLDLFKKFKWITLAKEITAAKNQHNYGYLKCLKMIIGITLPTGLTGWIRGLLSHDNRKFFQFSSDVLQKNPIKQFSAQSSVKEASLAQITNTNLQMLLHWEDRNSMAHGIEARVPFLDYRLVEYIFSLEDELKISNSVTKKILREAMIGILPDKVRLRMDKIGFVTPEIVWIKEYAPEVFRTALKEAVEYSVGIIQPEILDYFEKALSGKSSFDSVIWRSISFGVWMNVFKLSRQAD